MKKGMMDYDPVASRENIYTCGNARFQWLTSRMIRLEWEEQGRFEDRPTLAVINRNMSKVQFTAKSKGDALVLKSGDLTVTYIDDGKPFHKKNLSIEFVCSGKKKTWRAGQADKGNLKGTARTLDGIDGCLATRHIENPLYREGGPGDEGKKYVPIKCEHLLKPGLVSRDGWVVIDDSENIVIDGSGKDEWVASRPEGNRFDWYFLGYGHDYTAAVHDGAEIFGKQPLPPRYAFGYWWSRYWAYTDKEIEGLVESFDTMNVPIDVMVIDMDWHLPGWTGYTWDRNYFPDPDEFLAYINSKGLKVTLNLHPADGVAKHEEQFGKMAKAMGLNHKSAAKVEFDITDKKYMKHYFEILHHPEEKRGVEFWWMDWQQGLSSKIPGLDTLPWINHLHWHDMLNNPSRRNKRPLIFSRFGGIGAGRYCIGFSGDTYSNWRSLKYQPYFTSTAANTLYGYWSHDIGGHMPGNIEPELYTRWMQFGMYSPILRTHTTKNAGAERRVWEYPAPYNGIMMDVIRKRYEMVPYVYTECREACDHGVSLCRPMYYDYPEETDAYKAVEQYMFGKSMLVAPVVDPVNEADEMAPVKVWLPDGEWVDTARGCVEKGGRWISRKYLIGEVPVFVRPGAMVPGQTGVKRLDAASIENLVVTVYPGKEGEYSLYEDDGITQDYTTDKNSCALIKMSHKTVNGKKVVTIDSVSGSYKGFVAKKNVEVRLPFSLPPKEVKVGRDKLVLSFREKPNTWRYDGDTATIIITLADVDLNKGLTITLTEGKGGKVDGWAGVMARLGRVSYHGTLLTECRVAHKDERLPTELAQAGNRISHDPSRFAVEYDRLKKRIHDMQSLLAAYRKSPNLNDFRRETIAKMNCILKSVETMI